MAGISWGKKKKDEWKDIIGTMPSITGEQAAVSTPLSEYLAEALGDIGKRGQTFEDWMTGNVPDVFGGQLGTEAMGVYSEAMKGTFPEEYYQKAIHDPTMTEWMEDIMPAIKESYVATGAISGTEVGERLGKEGRRLGEYLGGVRAGLGQQAKERALMAAGQYTQAYQQNLGLAYSDYIRQNPAAADILQAALSYLNIPMMAAYQKPIDEYSGTAAATPAKPKTYYEWIGGRYQNVGTSPVMKIKGW